MARSDVTGRSCAPDGREMLSRAVRLGVHLSVLVLVATQVLGVGRPGTAPPRALTAPAATPADATGPAHDSPTAPAVPAPGSEDVRDDAPSSEDPAHATPWVIVEQEEPPAPPLRLRLPTIEVAAEVVPVGLEADGAMEVPADVRTVGWFDPFGGAGLSPGEPGTAVIAGHVDSRTQGRGAFWLLRDLRPGDTVEVEHADGTTSTWRVEHVERYPKDDIPIEDIFTFDGPTRLALITCGGEFDRSTGSYLENYVVTAVPAMSPASTSTAPSIPLPNR